MRSLDLWKVLEKTHHVVQVAYSDKQDIGGACESFTSEREGLAAEQSNFLSTNASAAVSSAAKRTGLKIYQQIENNQ